MGVLLSSKPLKRLFIRNTGIARDQRMTTTYVFRKQKVAYIKIPKAACTSIITALLPLTGRTFDEKYNVHKSQSFEVHGFDRCKHLFDEGWFIFTVVRNPIDRALSAWRDKCGASESFPSRMKLMGINKGDTLDQFVSAIERWPEKSLDDHIMPQTLLLRDAEDWPVKVFKFEHFDQDWPIIAQGIAAKCGIELAQLPKRNTSKRPEKAPAPDIVERLSKIYDEDFRQLGYSKPA